MAALGKCATLVAVLAVLAFVLGGCERAQSSPAPMPSPSLTAPSRITPTTSPSIVPEPTMSPSTVSEPTMAPSIVSEPTMAPSIVPEPTPSPPLAPDSEGEPMILTVVFDNNAFEPGLQTGWGFAAWVEYEGHVVLFDTGADGTVLLSNMAALGLDPRAVEIVVLSHVHGDHTGGLAALLAVNPQVTVYLPQAFPARLKGQARAAGATVVEVADSLEIAPGLWSTGQMGTDIIEQALAVKAAQGLVVITGCAHPGVDRMVARAKEIGQDSIHLVVGGFHLSGASRQRIEEIIAALQQQGVQRVAPCHCTGDQARALFQQAFGQDFLAVGVGWHWQSETVAWKPAGQGIPALIGVAAVALAPANPQILYLAAFEPGGLYRSNDGGLSWEARQAGLEPLAPLVVAVHPANADVAWVGTMAGGFCTTDGGQNWLPLTGLPPMALYALAVTQDGRTLYAGGEAPGVWRSDDGGQTWSAGGSPGPGSSLLSLAVAQDGAVFAGTAGEGVWASYDYGHNWSTVGLQLAETYVPVVVTALDGRLYALASGQLYLRSDGGGTWDRIGPPDFEALSFAVAPAPAGRLYLGSKGHGLAVSADGGETWTREGDRLRHADITCLVADPTAPDLLYLGTRDHGLYRTYDGGASWTLISTQIGRPVVAALADNPADDQSLYAGALDGVYRSDNGGAHWQLASDGMGKVAVQSLAVSPTGQRVYAGTRVGILISEDGGAIWRWAETEVGPISIFHISVDPDNAEQIYAGSWGHNVLRSQDGGQTWTPIHHGLETLSVYAFAIDPSDPQVLYAGTVEAVYRSTDGGESWQYSPLSNRPLTTFALAIDPSMPAIVYAGTTEGVFCSADAGQTWQPTGRASLDATVTALVLEPADPLTLYAGTEHHGLYRSTDRGQHWQPWGLAGASVYAIMVDSQGTMWVGTDQGIFRER